MSTDQENLNALKERSGNLVAPELEDPKSLLDIFEAKDGRTDAEWVFRGMKDMNYPLKPSLERTCEFFDVPNRDDSNGKGRKHYEREILRAFTRNCQPYLNNQPSNDDVLEWLALMQHHGAPTRLLDWTYSVFVAAYFATNEMSSNGGIIWAVDKKWLNDYAKVKLNVKNGRIPNRVWDNDPWPKDKKIFLEKVWHGRVDCVLSATPFRQNERLSIQQGTFLVPCNIQNSFQENLLAMQPGSTNLRNIVIPYRNRQKILKFLKRTNISDASLFPGIDGFARSTRYRFLVNPVGREPGARLRRHGGTD